MIDAVRLLAAAVHACARHILAPAGHIHRMRVQLWHGEADRNASPAMGRYMAKTKQQAGIRVAWMARCLMCPMPNDLGAAQAVRGQGWT